MNRIQKQSTNQGNVRLFGLAIRTFSSHMLKYACFVSLIQFPSNIDEVNSLWKSLLSFYPLFLGMLISGLFTISTIVKKARFQISTEAKGRLRILRNVGICVAIAAFLLFNLTLNPSALTIPELNRALQLFCSLYFCLALLLHTLDLLSKPPDCASPPPTSSLALD